ncbi:uncharacterized protein [Medicago truncatula]|uniref:Defensin-like protein n=1 Tax=Medicago truncatula TaxID=3880 RepID=A0A072TMS5_MEDTR|nr:uncharacterized protein LOC25500300 isoform X1 [Medicago truncatula]KEH18153.1 Defensin-like protein [Medicago truncatula]
MTSSASKFYTIFIFVCLAFLFISTSEVEAKLCQKRSTTWSGPCLNTGNCKRQCINVEHATFGACHRQGFGFACFCYKKCAPKSILLTLFFKTIIKMPKLKYNNINVTINHYDRCISPPDICEVEPKLCERRSKTWSGPCLISGNCKRQCINVEHATSGACHRQGIGFACFCKKKC